MESWDTALITIIVGISVVIIGNLLSKAIIDPGFGLKQQIGTIAHDLDFFANRIGEDEATKVMRAHACKLREWVNTIVAYWLVAPLIGLPSKKNVLKASRELIGLSNTSKDNFETSQPHKREQAIKGFLHIKT